MNGVYDIVVIGGGIHGVGVAQAAAAAGHSVLVIERSALAAGTSSRSSKLIHGGLRYLETGQFGLVRESLREREILLRIAPELVRLVPFHIPIYADSARRPWTIRAGLTLYALLGGLATATRFQSLARDRWEGLDGLTTRGLQAVFQYWDAQTDDAALTCAVMRSAQALGAELACPATFLGAERRPDGFEVRYATTGREAGCRAAALVNAAGPWIGDVLANIAPSPAVPAVELVQGSHVVFDGALERGVYFVEAPRDRRALFAMPWQGKTLVGTTELSYRGDPAEAKATPAEIEYLTETFERYFPGRASAPIASFCGLRVLPAGTAPMVRRPREILLFAEPATAPRLVTIAGGKLTGYRATAAKVLARLAPALPARTPRAATADIMLNLE
ncbi:MAG: FAD-dependent oxidoreductase [Gammaproteobacteria bacterium]|nr:FAD-dependent oxidoreductase [Gammaproteobacteria bacterium]